MIVVVIIGILASVAIPSYQGFQARAKATEAKVQLSAIYSAEKAYFSETTHYSGSLVDIGASGTEKGKYYEAIGFAGVAITNYIGGAVHAACGAKVLNTGAGTAITGTDYKTAKGFKACAQIAAEGTSNRTFTTKIDWWINNKKELKSAPVPN